MKARWLKALPGKPSKVVVPGRLVNVIVVT
jgi:hypothetical protein